MSGVFFCIDVILNGEAEKDPVQKPLQSPWPLILTMPCHPGHSAGVSFYVDVILNGEAEKDPVQKP
jgi:hypothetical protein